MNFEIGFVEKNQIDFIQQFQLLAIHRNHNFCKIVSQKVHRHSKPENHQQHRAISSSTNENYNNENYNQEDYNHENYNHENYNNENYLRKIRNLKR